MRQDFRRHPHLNRPNSLSTGGRFRKPLFNNFVKYLLIHRNYASDLNNNQCGLEFRSYISHPIRSSTFRFPSRSSNNVRRRNLHGPLTRRRMRISQIGFHLSTQQTPEGSSAGRVVNLGVTSQKSHQLQVSSAGRVITQKSHHPERSSPGRVITLKSCHLE